MTGPIRRGLLLLAAAASGAAGLGLESVLVSVAGLSLGFSRASALGLGAFVAGWALGAFGVSLHRGPASRALLFSGAATLLLSWVVPGALLRAAFPGAAAVLLAVGLCAVPQGAVLPLLARIQGRGGIGLLFAANLAGSVAGARAIGFGAVAGGGRLRAAAIAGVLSLLAAAIGALASRGTALAHVEGGGGRSRWAAGWVLGLATLWTLGLEWIGLRLGVLWIGSQQLALTSILAAGLAALALGAALLPRLVHGGERGVLELLALQLVLATWPLFAAPALRALAGAPAELRALALVGPPLVALGGLVPVLHRTLPGESGARLGRLLLHEAWGALAAGPLLHWMLVPRLGLGGSLGALSASAALAALPLARRRPRAVAALVVLAALAGALALAAPEPALATPVLTDPALTVRSFAEDSEFAVAVVDDGLLGERTLLTDRFRAAGNGRAYTYMRVLGHLPLLLHPGARRVAVVALGTGTTVGAVSLHAGVEEIDVLEISPAVVAAAPWFEDVNRGALGDPRVNVVLGDGRRSLAERRERYDVITIEPLLPDSPFGVYLYTPGFYAAAKRALRRPGLVCQWVPPHALEPEVFDAVVGAFTDSFEESSVWLFGAQVILLGVSGPAGSEGGGSQVGPAPPRFSGPARGELALELEALGLQDSAGLLARRVASGARWPDVPRPLTDADPWITYREKPTGVAVLGWLPQNLQRVLDVGGELPLAWRDAGGAGLGARVEGLRALTRARALAGQAEHRATSVARSRAEWRAEIDRELARAARLAPGDPDVEGFRGDVRFLRALREGVSLVAGGDAAGALGPLITAAELRPERADVHLYLALALHALGSGEAAGAAMKKALEACPRLRETPAGRRASLLGLPEEAWGG